MRNIKLTCLLVVCSYAANAQFTIQPQIGLENSRTAVYNDQSKIPTDAKVSPKFSFRMDYKFKKNHGPYIGLSTSAPVIDFTFSDPVTAANSYSATKQNLQLRFEGGYQLSTKPIYFSKPAKSNVSSYRSSGKCGDRESYSSIKKTGCGKSSAAKSSSKSSSKSIAKNKGSYMRIIPSAGFAFIPGQPSEIETKTQGTQTTYSYKAGAWNTAFTAGTGFEFGSNNRPKFTVNVNYLHGLGNMDTETLNTISNGKPVSTTFHSKSSGWNVSLGIPISLSKRKPVVQKQVERFKYNGKCGQSEKIQYRSGCGQKRI